MSNTNPLLIKRGVAGKRERGEHFHGPPLLEGDDSVFQQATNSRDCPEGAPATLGKGGVFFLEFFLQVLAHETLPHLKDIGLSHCNLLFNDQTRLIIIKHA